MNSNLFYYLDKSGTPQGPVSLKAAVELYQADQLSEPAQLCREGENDWKPLAEFLPRASKQSSPIANSEEPPSAKSGDEASARSMAPTLKIALVSAGSLLVIGLLFVFAPLLLILIAIAAVTYGAVSLKTYRSGETDRAVLLRSVGALGAGGFALVSAGFFFLLSLTGIFNGGQGHDRSIVGDSPEITDISDEEFRKINRDIEEMWQERFRNTPPIEGASPFSNEHPGNYVPPQFRDAQRRFEQSNP